MAYGRPSKSPAWANSPAPSSSRIRVAEIRSPCRCTGAISPATKPCCSPSVRNRPMSPLRRWPKRNSGPIQTSRARSRATSASRTKSSARILDRRPSKRIMPTLSAPNPYRPSILARARVRRGGGAAGAKNSRGSGSKLTATAGTPSARARATACCTSVRCPRCRPSKAPMQTTLPRGNSVPPSTSLNSLLIPRSKQMPAGRPSLIHNLQV